MIPKRIHYCWFGKGEKPILVQKCIASWKKYCPDYQIIEWNEDNYDIDSSPLFVRQAIEMKKWAFSTDYIRYKVIYDNGGIYLDTDVEIIKNLDIFLKDPSFFGFDNNIVSSGLGFGAQKRSNIIQELMATYEKACFILADGHMDMTPCPKRDFPIFISHGLVPDGTEQILDDGTHIYPQDYFSPLNYSTGWMKKTKNTATIHWYSASWHTEKERKQRARDMRAHRKDYIIHFPNRIGMKLLGRKQYEKLKRLLGK